MGSARQVSRGPLGRRPIHHMLDENTQQEFIRRYAKLVCNADIWVSTARRLLASAELIGGEAIRRWEDMDFRKPDDQKFKIQDQFTPIDFQAVYLMLSGFALENLFKAYFIRKNRDSTNQSIKESGEIPGVIKNHDLRKLAQLCEMSLTDEMANLLDRITKHSIWRGRYHFPLDFETFYHLSPKNDIPSSGIGYSSDDVEVITTTVQSIAESLGFDLKRRSAR